MADKPKRHPSLHWIVKIFIGVGLLIVSGLLLLNDQNRTQQKQLRVQTQQLVTAIEKDDETTILALVKANPRLHSVRGSEGMTPLHRAADSGNQQLAEFLLAQGADVNVKNSFGTTPLHWVVHKGNREFAVFLIARGADANAKNNDGSTPLHGAAFVGNKEIAELLLAHGASVDAVNNDARTPLKLAREYGHAEVAELLRYHGAKE